MRSVIAFSLLAICATASPLAAESVLPTLYRVELGGPSEDATPGPIALSVASGDRIEVSVRGGTYPGGMISDVKVVTKGTSVAKDAVLRVDQEMRVGGIELVVVLKANTAGLTEIHLTPTGEGVSPKVSILNITVKK